MNSLFGREPVLWLGLVRALVVAAAAFGFELSAEQVASIYLACELVLSFITRQNVSPVGGTP